MLRALERGERARRLGGLAQVLAQRRMQDVLDERRFSRSGDSRDADQAMQRDVDVDVLQIMLGGTADAETHGAAPRITRERVGNLRAGDAPLLVRQRRIGAAASREVFGGKRPRLLELLGRAEEYDLAAAFARAGAHVQQLV